MNNIVHTSGVHRFFDLDEGHRITGVRARSNPRTDEIRSRISAFHATMEPGTSSDPPRILAPYAATQHADA